MKWGHTNTEGGPGAPHWDIRVFGRFAVEFDGREVPAMGPVPSRAVKFLAIAPQPVHVERLMDVLWPGTDPTVARTRLRNVVARIRSACGPLVVRSGDAVVLAGGADVDLWRFESDAVIALTSQRSDPAVANAAARRALSLYAGELLPGDIYAEWAQPARLHTRRLADALYDAIATPSSRRADGLRSLPALAPTA